jgi:hypothetical protein
MKPPLLVRRTFYGRTFSVQELELMRQVASDCAALGVTEIARTLCELLDWKRPSGRLKNHECRQLLEHLRDEGWLQLPSLRQVGPRGPRRIDRSKRGEPQPEITVSAGDLEPLILTLVKPGPESTFWNELIDRYHYLGYRVPVGAHLRYFVRSAPLGEPILACLQWSSAAWKIKARDRWIGWTDQQRARNLQFIVNHSRYLILPWVRVAGLASKILAHCARQLPRDWERRYRCQPLLLESFVDARRFSGTCYRAANWILLGETRGRGRMDRRHQLEGASPKLIFVYPLCRDAQERLSPTNLV